MTKIEWCDDTINPITGCTPISPGCQNCYAAAIAKRFWGDRKFSDIQFHLERLEEFSKGKPGKKKFIGSMCDLFHEDVWPIYVNMVISTIQSCPQHTFIILTKRPDRILSDFKFPNNVWLGVTTENQQMADERIPILLQIPAAVRFISVEPMLGKIDILKRFDREATNNMPIFHWVICGAETGTKARHMQLDWAIDLKNQCKAANVPFFFKKASKRDIVPDELNIREFPRTIK